MANFLQSASFNGLGTMSTTVDTAGPYYVKGQLSLPTLVSGMGASLVVVTINLNGGGALYTGLAGAEGFYKDLLCAAGDIINVILSSGAAPDQPLNVIKSNISIGSGQ